MVHVDSRKTILLLKAQRLKTAALKEGLREVRHDLSFVTNIYSLESFSPSLVSLPLPHSHRSVCDAS